MTELETLESWTGARGQTEGMKSGWRADLRTESTERIHQGGRDVRTQMKHKHIATAARWTEMKALDYLHNFIKRMLICNVLSDIFEEHCINFAETVQGNKKAFVLLWTSWTGYLLSRGGSSSPMGCWLEVGFLLSECHSFSWNSSGGESD